MSQWYEPKYEDMFLDDNDKSISAYLYSDNMGAVYATFKIEDIEKVIKENKQV